MKSLPLYLFLFCSGSLFAQFHTYTIQYIQISGNKRTKDIVFYREIGKTEGDTIHTPEISTVVWQKRLSGLGLFNYVAVDFKRDTLFIDVKERIYTWVMPRLTWADRNFNVWYQTKDFSRLIYGGIAYFNNLGGLNHSISLTCITGYNNIYEIAYNYPISHYSRGWGFSAKVGLWNNHELWYKTENDKLQFLKKESGKIQENKYAQVTEKKRINYWSRLELTQAWINNRIDSVAFAANPNYLLFSPVQNEYDCAIEYINDHRDQRDYPSQGYLFRFGFKESLLSTKTKSQFIHTISFRFTHFKPLFDRNDIVLAYSFTTRLSIGTLPYNLSRQLGYQNDYVRGYEPYVVDGGGFVLGKIALRKALFSNKVLNLGNRGILKNYRKIPMAAWINIFSDAGSVYSPYDNFNQYNNGLAHSLMAGVGMGLEVIAWYSAMARFEYSFNAMGEGYFNVSFKNAF